MLVSIIYIIYSNWILSYYDLLSHAVAPRNNTTLLQSF